MLAIGRALMTNPKLLILMKLSEGLVPLIREEIWSCLSLLKSRGQSDLVVDKNVDHLARICDRHYIIERGKTVWSGTSVELMAEPDLQHKSSWASDALGCRRFVRAGLPRAQNLVDVSFEALQTARRGLECAAAEL